MQIILQINFYLWLVACLRHALDYLAFSPLPHTACGVTKVSCLRHDSRVPAARYTLIPAQAQRSVGFKGSVGRAVWGTPCVAKTSEDAACGILARLVFVVLLHWMILCEHLQSLCQHRNLIAFDERGAGTDALFVTAAGIQ